MTCPRQIGRGTSVVAVDATRRCPAQRAGYRRCHRSKDDDHLVICEVGIFEHQPWGIG